MKRFVFILLPLLSISAWANCDDELRSWKSQDHVALEKEIRNAHLASQTEAQAWMRSKPFRGAWAFANMIFRGEVSDSTARAWQNLPAWKQYHDAFQRLADLDRNEGFPAMKAYADQLDELARALPAHLKEKAYYPFAGTDFYWSRIFKQIVFEDLAYDQEFSRTMWWDHQQYSARGRERVLDDLIESKTIPADNKRAFLKGNGNVTRLDNDFNQADQTWIVKGGHSILPFLKKRFASKPLNFGAAIFVSPADHPDHLKAEMLRRGYRLTYEWVGESFYAPYSMGLQNIYVFLKQ